MVFDTRVSGSQLLASLAVAALLGAGSISAARAEANELAGSWSGSGRIVLPSGDTERARCRASFRKQGGKSYSMSATCTTPSVTVAQTARVSRVSDTGFSGSFNNAEFGISGSISITVRGSRLTASLSGGGSSGTINLSK